MESLLDYFQDCSTFHSEDLGVGLGYLADEHRAWLLNNWQIIFKTPPKLGDKVIVGTFAYDMRGFLGYRNFFLDAPDGTRLAYANSLWSYIDTDTGHPAKVPQEVIDLYGKEPKLEMDYAPRKIIIPDGGEAQPKIQIQPHHLDTNHHVNNGQYIRMAGGFLPEEKKVEEMRSEFRRQAFLGDELYPVTVWEREVLSVSLNDAEGNEYAAVQFYCK